MGPTLINEKFCFFSFEVMRTNLASRDVKVGSSFPRIAACVLIRSTPRNLQILDYHHGDNYGDVNDGQDSALYDAF